MRLWQHYITTLMLALPLALAKYTALADEAPTPKSIKLSIEGEFQPVFNWAKSQCEKMDLPDAGLRAFRRADNSVEAFAAHYTNYFMLGPSLLDLKKQCHSAYPSGHNANPAAFDDQTWIAATWTDDGRHVMAVGHLEYHGELYPGRCEAPKNVQCRYGALLDLNSDDEGAHFTKSPNPLAAAPAREEPNQKPSVGIFQPSNIFEHDGWKYVFARSSGGGAQPAAACLLRSRDPMNEQSWQIFDGDGWESASFNPYTQDWGDRKPCAQVSTLNGIVWSVLTFRPTGVLVAVISVIEPQTGKPRLATSTSSDALHWSKLDYVDLDLEWGAPCPKSPALGYPSLMDPSSTRRNFDDTGTDAVIFVLRACA
jgi:hypothetical protein